MSNDNEKEVENPLRDQAGLILKMTKYADKLTRVLGAESVIVIGVFKDGNQLRVQDAGRFIMPPHDFYTIMQAAHINGQMGKNSPKVKPVSRIIKPH